MATMIAPASAAQHRYINSLRSQRNLAGLTMDELKVLDTRDASREIDRLLRIRLPRGRKIAGGR